MTNPYAVPLEDLDDVHVIPTELVEEQQSDLRWVAGGVAVHPFGDGMSGDADGE